MKRYVIALLVITLVGVFNLQFANGQKVTDEAGLKLLIDFDVYQLAINKMKGYVVARYGVDSASFTVNGKQIDDTKLAQEGIMKGQPIIFNDGRYAVKKDGYIYKNDDLLRNPQPGESIEAYRSRLLQNDPTLTRDKHGALEYAVTRDDMHLDKWLVELNSSANTIKNRANSYCKQVVVSYPDQGGEKGRKVLGIRIHFPNHNYNAYAKISPPYPFYVYDAAGKELKWQDRKDLVTELVSDIKARIPNSETTYIKVDPDTNEERVIFNNGVLYNVGQIKTITSYIAGRNYKNGLAIRLRDNSDEVKEYFLGYMNYSGWRKLAWRNPNYITEVDHREIFRIPLYPMERPYRVFDSFIIYRSGLEIGGNFVCYIKDVWVDYDLAIAPQEDVFDIEDDDIWMILRDKNMIENEKERKKFADKIDIRKQEEARMKRSHLTYPDNPGTKHEQVKPDDDKSIGSVFPKEGTDAPAPAATGTN
jgi:hypothetical protein